MVDVPRQPITDTWDERLNAFRHLCTVTGTAALVLVICHAAISLAGVLRKLLW
jgi:hypothetical protein